MAFRGPWRPAVKLAGTSRSHLPPVCADCQPELWQDDSHCSASMPGGTGTHSMFPNFSPLFRHRENRRMAFEGLLVGYIEGLCVWVSTRVGKLLNN